MRFLPFQYRSPSRRDRQLTRSTASAFRRIAELMNRQSQAQNRNREYDVNLMKCPIDSNDLVMTERQGIEVDYCPKCRGVWLDRGELDKIIERSTAAASPPSFLPPQPQAGPQPRNPQPAYEPEERHSPGVLGARPALQETEVALPRRAVRFRRLSAGGLDTPSNQRPSWWATTFAIHRGLSSCPK